MKKEKKKLDAFVSSERHVLSGLRLEPWTPDRSICAQSLGLIYPNLGKEDWASVRRGGAYPGAVRDVALTLYISTLSPDQVLDLEANGEKEAKRLSGEWAGEHGIHNISKQAFWDALSKCMEIWNEVNESVTLPVKESDSGDDDSGND